MKRYYLLAVLAVALGISCQGPTNAAIADVKMQQLVDTLDAVGLSVAVIKDNQLVYANAFGYKNLENKESLQPNDLMRIASISKSFTATSIMQLCEAGKFSLDDDISDALGFSVRNPRFPDQIITYRMLLSHTSSLSDAAGYFVLDVINPAKTPDVSGSFHEYAPGQGYEYCNLGFNTLGTLVEIHSGERFDTYVENHILKPLGLNASFNVNHLDSTLFATIYAYEEGSFVPSYAAYNPRKEDIANYVLGYSTPIFSPTGGMKICASDLAKHMRIQMNAGSFEGVTILTPESVKQMQTPQSRGERPTRDTTCGYGFALETTDRLIEGEMMTGHTGGAYGLLSAMYFNPEKKFGFVMMTNGCNTSIPYGDNGFAHIQSDVINALYDIFIR